MVQNSVSELDTCNSCLRVFLYLVEVPAIAGEALNVLNVLL